VTNTIPIARLSECLLRMNMAAQALQRFGRRPDLMARPSTRPCRVGTVGNLKGNRALKHCLSMK